MKNWIPKILAVLFVWFLSLFAADVGRRGTGRQGAGEALAAAAEGLQKERLASAWAVCWEGGCCERSVITDMVITDTCGLLGRRAIPADAIGGREAGGSEMRDRFLCSLKNVILCFPTFRRQDVPCINGMCSLLLL